MVMPVVLWTDALLFLLFAALLVFVVQVRRRPHLLQPWRQVLHSRMGIATLVILVFYVLVALLDSLHFRVPLDNGAEAGGETFYSVEVYSVFDELVAGLRERGEKTYSAPLATHLYSKETIERADGSQLRDYPRLRHGGAALPEDGSGHGRDIALRLLAGLLLGIVLWALPAALLVAWLARRRRLAFAAMLRRIVRRDEALPWHVLLLTAAVIVVLLAVAAGLSSGYYVLGTDKVGQDVFYQSLKSIRTALAIGTLTTLVMLPFALLLGMMAGYFRGWVDDVIQYLYTTLSSIPGVLLIAAAVLMLDVYIANHPDLFDTDARRADARLFFLCVILGITSWAGLCRMLRGETMKLRELEYVQAATAFGVRRFRILLQHIMPNVMHIVLISIVLDFSGLVLAEAVLSYIGVGVDPSMNSWGNMINSARLEMAREPMVWWSLLSAFFFMFVLVLAANLFSDVVRDAFDPRMRR